jgi:hypothetical protein
MPDRFGTSEEQMRKEDERNGYGQNHAIDGTQSGDHTVADDTAEANKSEGTIDQLDRTREEGQGEESPEGGMGRRGTPKIKGPNVKGWQGNFELAGEPETPRD